MLITEPGVYPDIPNSEYHGREICDGPSISASGIKAILECPRKYWWNSPLNPNRPRKKATRPQALGSAVHCLLLTPGLWADEFHVVPDGFSAAHHKKWHSLMPAYEAAIEAGKEVLTQAQADAAMRMVDALQADPVARMALVDGRAEATLAWRDEETGVWVRCRPDWLPNNPTFVPDLKKVRDASPDGFARAVRDYGYHVQAAVYMEGIEKALGVQVDDFFFLTVEEEPPHVVQAHRLSDSYLEAGRILFRQGLRRFADCLAADKWPGYADDVSEIDCPKWLKFELGMEE